VRFYYPSVMAVCPDCDKSQSGLFPQTTWALPDAESQPATIATGRVRSPSRWRLVCRDRGEGPFAFVVEIAML
jgi:hypothetical protein